MPHLHTYDIIFQHVKKVRRARKNQTRAQNHSLHCFICGEYMYVMRVYRPDYACATHINKPRKHFNAYASTYTHSAHKSFNPIQIELYEMRASNYTDRLASTIAAGCRSAIA